MTEETLEVRAYQEYLRQRAMWNRSKAEQGDTNAQYNLGWMYDNGTGVAQDYVEAVRLYRLAAEQGHVSAQGYLGAMYANGEGVAQDDAEADRWFRLADEDEED